ncbi:MAG: hypothetical protein HKP58_04350 [Desulfatitalea sp.]|nr:hypothetical protein [Desulfatitalea sp.]NNJ99622.1 hypothetical protein [Desulfatitalea sp.]
MMHQPHKIGEAVFNMAFATCAQVMHDAATLPGLITNRLAPCMDEVFEEFKTGQDVVRIDYLQIDLGAVADEDLETALTHHLRQALQSAIQTPSSKNVRRDSPRQAGLALIAHYLMTGTLPWTNENAGQNDICGILGDLINQAPHALVTYLRGQTGLSSPVLPRLARQFKSELLLRLLPLLTSHLSPRDMHGIRRTITAVTRLHERRALLPVSGREFAGLVWETVLRRLLSPGHDQVSPWHLMASAFKAAAKRHHVPLTLIRKRLKDADPRARPGPDRMVADLLAALDSDSAPAATPEYVLHSWTALKSALLDAMCHQRMDGFADAWRRMRTGFPEPTLATIRQYARQARVRRAIARQFSPRQFQELIVLVQPQHADFIARVMQHHAVIEQVVPEPSGNPEKVSGQLREFTLTFLLADGTSRFNRKQYCAGVIRHLAAHHNMAYKELVADFHTFFTRTIDVADPTGRQLLEILDEIHEEENPSTPRPRLKSENTHTRPLASADTPVLGHDTSGGMRLDAVQRLLSTHPAALARWLRRNPANAKTVEELAGLLPDKLLARLRLMRITDRHAAWRRYIDINDPIERQFIIQALNPTQTAPAPSGQGKMDMPREKKHTRPLASADTPVLGRDTSGGMRLDAVQRLLNTHPAALARWLRRNPANAKTVEKLAGLLPDKLLARLRLMRITDRHAAWRRYLNIIVTAAGKQYAADHSNILQRQAWASALSLLSRNPAHKLTAQDFVRHVAHHLAQKMGEPKRAAFYQHLQSPSAMGNQPTGQNDLMDRQFIIQALNPTKAAPARLGQAEKTPGGNHSPEKHPNHVNAEEQNDPTESIFVQNAGMVLAAPFLPRLFNMLNLLENNKFRTSGTAQRAVHILEYLVRECTMAPEFQLTLNKILCGLTSARPIAGGIDITPQEIASVNSLILSMIAHWKTLGNTSPEGLRTSFLQRRGYLTLKKDAWHLQVEACAYDMLLDQLPWHFAVIKHPWMNRVLHVNWR